MENLSIRMYQALFGTINYPNDFDFTRITEFKHLTGQTSPSTSIVREYPTHNGDPYYPIPRDENEQLFKQYQTLANKEEKVTFVGRLAEYRYYNMDQVVGAALNAVANMLEQKNKYARLYEIPNQLSLLGHDIECFCLSYQSHNEGIWDESNNSRSLKWHSRSYVGLRAWIAKKLNLPFVADLYDNLKLWASKIPFLSALFTELFLLQRLISTPVLVLLKKISKEHPEVPTCISNARNCGGLTKMKGIDDLFNAWEVVKKQNDQAYLILAGPTEKITPLPQDDRVIYLGLLSHEDVVSLFQALDVGVLCIPDDEFGRYCFPQKAYEMLATNLPVIGTNIGDLSRLLNYSFLYEFNNYMELSDKIQLQLIQQEVSDVTIPDWKILVTKLDDYLSNLVT
ncbi:hypothetical protein FQR65_LT19323 [Abscondita terminalis]|nr:hypothetical protein FQR65_LT19323 [Abscondita terminalis]